MGNPLSKLLSSVLFYYTSVKHRLIGPEPGESESRESLIGGEYRESPGKSQYELVKSGEEAEESEAEKKIKAEMNEISREIRQIDLEEGGEEQEKRQSEFQNYEDGKMEIQLASRRELTESILNPDDYV